MYLKDYIVQDEPEYLAKIQTIHGYPFLHLTFRKWSPSAFKKLLAAWALFRKTLTCTFYAISNGEDDDKWARFVGRLGFTYFRMVTCPDGKVRRCFISQEIP